MCQRPLSYDSYPHCRMAVAAFLLELRHIEDTKAMVLLTLKRHVPSSMCSTGEKMGIKLICLIGVIFLMLTDNQETTPENGDTYDAKYGQASLRHGYWWHFEDGDDDITVHATMFGKEYIYINDVLVSEKLGLKFNGHHEFDSAGAEYAVDFKLLNFLTSNMDCLIYKNGTLIGQHAISYFEGGLKAGLKKIWPLFIAGFAIGFVAGHFGVVYENGFSFGKWVAENVSGWYVLGTVAGLAGAVVYFYKKKKS